MTDISISVALDLTFATLLFFSGKAFDVFTFFTTGCRIEFV